MFQAKGDQPLGQAERDQALCRGARDLQHLSDLILGMTRDEIQPARASRIVQARTFAFI